MKVKQIEILKELRNGKVKERLTIEDDSGKTYKETYLLEDVKFRMNNGKFQMIEVYTNSKRTLINYVYEEQCVVY